MQSFYLDASSLAKRYVPETGSLLVDEILDKVSGDRIYVLNVGAGEVVSILARKRNSGVITGAYFAQALVDFDTEIVRSADIHKLPVSNRLATSSFSLIVAHSINSTDATPCDNPASSLCCFPLSPQVTCRDSANGSPKTP